MGYSNCVSDDSFQDPHDKTTRVAFRPHHLEDGVTMSRPADNRGQFRPADHPYDHFLLTTVVGSYPKAKWLNRATELVEDPNSKFDEYDLAEAHDDAARLITKEHERAGLDAVVDGEVRRNEMVEFFADRIDGYEFNGPVKVWGHNYFDKPSVASEISYGESWLLEEFKFTNNVATKPVKVPITGPYTLGTWTFNAAYDTDEELIYELAELVNIEVENLVAAGAKYIQIDEPALATTPDDHAIVGEALERIVSGIPADVRIGLHVCYGDYSRIYPECNEFPIDEIDLELCNDGYDQIHVFEDIEPVPDFSPGVLDVHSAEIESVDEIKSNILQGLRIVPPDRLTITPDCGLKLLDREIAYGKMENLVTAAREIEAELDAGEIVTEAVVPN